MFTVQWVYDIFVSYMAFYIFLPVILIYYFRFVYERNISKHSGEFEQSPVFTLWIAPISGLIVLIAFLMPANQKPLEWKWLDNKVGKIYSFLDNEFRGEKTFDFYSISSTGFGDGNNKLGGKVRIDRTLVLKVETPRRIYLKGIVKDYYNGSEWINTSKEKVPLSDSANKSYYDIAEMIEGLSARGFTSSDSFNRLFFKHKIKISYLKMKTKSLFAPLKTEKIIFQDNNFTAFADANGSLSSPKALKNPFSYSVDFFSPKYDSEDLKDYIRNSKNTSLNNDYSKYLQLPETLPGRVCDLARSVAASAGDDYDKVKAIEEYLSNNYKYTLNPRSTPRNRDFADYFLFEQKQGYCTYYASAMTLMVRSLGIPSRYVEGYALPSEPESGNTYYVTNEQAHAWVEVYFKGFGWLAFEPTSALRQAFYESGKTHNFYGDAYGAGIFDPELMRRAHMYGNSGIDPDMLDAESYSRSKNKIFIISVISGILLILASFMGWMLYNSVKRKIRYHRLKNLSAKESVISLYSIFLKVLTLHGLDVEPGETPFKFAQRVDKKLFLSPVNFKTITNTFAIARYSENKLDEKDKKVFCEFYDKIFLRTKSTLGKNRYFIYAFILGRL